MLRIIILNSSREFSTAFGRCCQEYENIDIAVAWSGNPKHVLPFSLLNNFSGKIRAIIGVSFNHTHPDAFDFLQRINADVRVCDQNGLFHPKLYIFRSGQKVAVFIGSSNFTYSGFYQNHEVNVLLEGGAGDFSQTNLNTLFKRFEEWRTDKFSFAPSQQWMTDYRHVFDLEISKAKTYEIPTPPRNEEAISTSSWLQNADWQTYYSKVEDGLRQQNRKKAGYISVLEAAKLLIPLPWSIEYFQDIEKRRIMFGGKKGEVNYGWLGHVGASGQFLHLLAKGSVSDQQVIAECVNLAGKMNSPIDWDKLESLLIRLEELGPTIKVWCRFLALVRPDLFCTIASVSVRKNLSKTLEIPQSQFEQSVGYIKLLQLIHSSSWFNSKKPTSQDELIVWDARAAFVDAIFHDAK